MNKKILKLTSQQILKMTSSKTQFQLPKNKKEKSSMMKAGIIPDSQIIWLKAKWQK